MGKSLRIFGIKTCDTCRAAVKAAEDAGLEVEFVDIRATPLDAASRARFLATFGEALVNRRSTTWRGLSEAERSGDAEALLAAHPTLMKRPVIEANDGLHVGWTPDIRAAVLG